MPDHPRRCERACASDASAFLVEGRDFRRLAVIGEGCAGDLPRLAAFRSRTARVLREQRLGRSRRCAV